MSLFGLFPSPILTEKANTETEKLLLQTNKITFGTEASIYFMVTYLQVKNSHSA